MIDFDRYKEILDTLTRNKTRSFLTGFGVFWGIFMLVALLGGGKGVHELLSATFKGFANNSGMFFAMKTTKPYEGLKKVGVGACRIKTWSECANKCPR